jgi:hypothetical protein
LQLDDFNSSSLDAMKDKFFELKKMAGVHSSGHRSFSRGSHSKGITYNYYLVGTSGFIWLECLNTIQFYLMYHKIVSLHMTEVNFV